ncbi:MAG: tetratricopeptide repeat protein [Acidobacteriota bacterium]|nr:tetratricopeptide repeat protein [Acidobacteriota bacterium]
MSKRRRGPSGPRPQQPAKAAPASGTGAAARRRPRWLLPAGMIVLLAAAGAAALLLVPRRPVARLDRDANQNVLLITLDTLRADALSCYGGPAHTPNLDRLARDGVRFDFAHAQAVLTLPSHTSILTGLYPFQHGVRDNSGFRLAAGTPTMATILQSDGWATGAFVSGFPLNARFGLNAGFTVYNDDFGETAGPADFQLASRTADQVVPLAEHWIEQQQGRWFEWLHLFDAHAPYDPPPPFNREYAGRPYYGEVAFIDKELGPLFDRLRTLDRPTLVIVTGDHGEALGEHGEQTHGIFAYEPTLRIPLIVAQIDPGERDPRRGEVSDVGARHVDILPTVLDALKLSGPADLPGRTLLPAAQRQRGAAPRPSYFESMGPMLNRGWAPLEGVILGHEKYIDLPLPELYNLRTDPNEQNNLIDVAADATERRTLEHALSEFHADLPGARRTESPEVVAELQSLGYTSGSAPRKAQYTADDDPKRLIALDQEIHKAVDLYERHHLNQAIALYQQIVAQRPMSVAYQHLAFIYWESGQVGQAMATLHQAIQHGVRDHDIQVQLATYLSETGRPQDALPILEAVTKTRPDAVDALNALGIAQARLGRIKDAMGTFQRVLALDPADDMAMENMGSVYLGENDLVHAEDAFRKALQANPRSSTARSGLGVVELKTGRTAEAVADWRQAIALNPTNYDALYNLAAELVREGDAGVARPVVEQFVRTAPPSLYADDIRAFSAWLARTQGQP